MLDVTTFIVGVLAGITYALSGYLKSSNNEKFDAEKFVRTVIIGAIVGGYAAYKGISMDKAYMFVISTGIVAYIDNALKFISRLKK